MRQYVEKFRLLFRAIVEFVKTFKVKRTQEGISLSITRNGSVQSDVIEETFDS